MKNLYTGHVVSHGGREGTVRSSDGRLDLQLSAPKEESSPGSPTNPEQLFAAAYSACYHSAVKSWAKSKDLPCENSEVTASVSLLQDEEEIYRLAVRLDVYIPGLSERQVQEVADKAHETCPYSKMTRGDVQVEVKATSHQS